MTVNYILDAESMKLLTDQVRRAGDFKYRVSLAVLTGVSAVAYSMYLRVKEKEKEIDELNEMVDELSRKLDDSVKDNK